MTTVRLGEITYTVIGDHHVASQVMEFMEMGFNYMESVTVSQIGKTQAEAHAALLGQMHGILDNVFAYAADGSHESERGES